MIIKYSNELPFWINGEDKIISIHNWNKYIDYDNSFKVNIKDFENVSVITKNQELQYFIYQDKNSNWCGYYKVSQELLANETYIMNFKLDVWGTYSNDIVKNLKKTRLYIKRSHDIPYNHDELSIYEDEKFKNITPRLLETEKIAETTKLVNGFYVPVDPQFPDKYKVGFKNLDDSITNICFVWKDTLNFKYVIAPVFKNINYINHLSTNAGSFTNQAFNNTIEKLKKINEVPDMMNKFIGIFTIPSTLSLVNLFHHQYAGLPNAGESIWCGTNELFGEYSINGRIISYDPNPFTLGNSQAIYNFEILNYMDITLCGKKIDAMDCWWKNTNTPNPGIYLRRGYIGFNEHYFTYFVDSPLQKLEERTKPLAGPLASTSNPFLEYIAQNRNRINSGIFGAASSGVGGLANIGLGVATGNPFAVLNGIMGVGNAGLNMAKQIGEIKDTRNKLLPTQNASYDKDNVFYGEAFKANNDRKFYSLLIKRKLGNLSTFNDQVVFYGYIQNRYIIPSFEFTNIKTHYYLQIDANEYYLRFKDHFKNIPLKFTNEILQILNEGVRFWESEIRYNYA